VRVDDRNIPLCVDCDGTLLKSDLLHESLLLLVKQAPLALFLLPFWLLRGKVYFKERIAERVSFNWSTLPYSDEVLALIKVARQQGRPVILATASPRVWADGVATHLGVFDGVLATQDGVNLGGTHKAQRLVDLHGERGFDYAGNGSADVPVWKRARAGMVVSSRSSLLKAARAATEVTHVVPVERAGLLTYLRALRLHQWLKNLLVWVPLMAAHQLTSSEGLLRGAVAFLAFSLCASAVYVINDLLDLESDRQHVRKRKRPFASTAIPLRDGVLLVPLLLGASIGLSLLLPPVFALVLGVYFTMTLAYSLRLKRQVIVDVLMLAGLYTMRIIAGAAATAIVPSFWLLAFSMFIFLSLAMVKRYSEMWITLQQSKQTAAGRGYSVNDLPVLMSLGASAAMAAVLVLALYVNDPETRLLYPGTHWLWMVPPLLLYWVSRVWMKAHRGEIDDDPVVFAARDWQSLVTVLLMGVCLTLASLA
jgi:4-hydroxybenzoate polyprenyltransferase/phosphoserine phosphatase